SWSSSPGSASPTIEVTRASPAPYSSTRQLTSSSAVAAASGPACARSEASSPSTCSPTFSVSFDAPITPPSKSPSPPRALELRLPSPFVASSSLLSPDGAGALRLAGSHRQLDAGGGVRGLEHLPAAEVHVDAARQARVEAADRAHDVDALEVVLGVLLEDRRVLHRVLVRARCPVDVADAAVPRGGRVRVVV